jgi:hypothetical protein
MLYCQPMSKSKNINLKEALKKNKLNQFIKERVGQAGNKPDFDATLSSMVGKSPKAPATSGQDDSVN